MYACNASIGWFCCWYKTLQNNNDIYNARFFVNQVITEYHFTSSFSPYWAPSVGIALGFFHGVPIRNEGIVYFPLCREASPEQIQSSSWLWFSGHCALQAPDGSSSARCWLAERYAAVVQPACVPTYIFNDDQVLLFEYFNQNSATLFIKAGSIWTHLIVCIHLLLKLRTREVPWVTFRTHLLRLSSGLWPRVGVRRGSWVRDAWKWRPGAGPGVRGGSARLRWTSAGAPWTWAPAAGVRPPPAWTPATRTGPFATPLSPCHSKHLPKPPHRYYEEEQEFYYGSASYC